VRVLFTLSQASVLFIDGIRSKLCNNDGVNLRAASQLQSDMELWKDGYYALQLHARWDTPNFPTAYPAINLRLNAGSYWVEYRIADPSELLFNASLTSPPAANAKVFVKHSNANIAMVAIQGLNTTDAWLAYDPGGGNRSPAWTHNSTTTTLRAVNYGDQPVRLYVNAGDFTTANRAVLSSTGWSYDDKGGTYWRYLSGTTTFSTPPSTSAQINAYLIDNSLLGNYKSIVFSIIS